MSLKLTILVSLLAAAVAIQVHQPIHVKSHEIEDGPVEYEFSYSVNDKHTGDIKAHKEVRKGDRVDGSYELIDSDGYRRVVQYRSDKDTGFEALVHREPTHIKIPIPEPKHKFISRPISHYVAPQISHYVRSEPRSIELRKSDHIGYGNHVSFSGLGVSYHY